LIALLLTIHKPETSMTGPKDATKTEDRNHGAFGSEPPAEKDALKRYKDEDQLQPQGSPAADKRPTDPEAIERSDLSERDKQYGSDDN